jgi:hypothetical protein
MGYILSKIGQRKNMESLLNDGSVYMHQLKYYKKLENDNIIGDNNEGLAAYYSGLNPTLTCQIKSEIKLISFHPKEIKIFGVHNEHAVYCMYEFNSGDIDIDTWAKNIDKRIFGFGDTMIIIRLPKVFYKKLYKTAQKAGYELDSRPIEYVSSNYCGEIGPFRKFDEYKYQSEIRFITNKPTDGILQLKLGSLKEISIMIDLKTMKVLHC